MRGMHRPPMGPRGGHRPPPPPPPPPHRHYRGGCIGCLIPVITFMAAIAAAVGLVISAVL